MTVRDLEALREESLAADETGQYRQGYEFTFGGIAFRVPPQRLWPMKVVRHARNGELDLALAVLVGDETADALIEAGMLLDDFERVGALASGPDGGGTGPPGGRSSGHGR